MSSRSLTGAAMAGMGRLAPAASLFLPSGGRCEEIPRLTPDRRRSAALLKWRKSFARKSCGSCEKCQVNPAPTSS